MDVNEEIKKIQERNNRVELDKAWETSLDQKNLYLYLNIYCSYYLFIFNKNIKQYLVKFCSSSYWFYPINIIIKTAIFQVFLILFINNFKTWINTI